MSIEKNYIVIITDIQERLEDIMQKLKESQENEQFWNKLAISNSTKLKNVSQLAVENSEDSEEVKKLKAKVREEIQ
ncbi:hypothetical protein HMPREF1143_1721 [Peptoanaerobacter stomatis]|uniref:Uncharacterized protein n=1 Tax=Peptoanaerobacter stomatis TaxID=796937 RepID=J6HIR5_9FIRM|nr:hypothetical protein [Peptoanaerobacter stomatis]EJU22528.1 hypothetical protein HMPREF1143_1721 [Peptoanaerobacter stomatis]